MKIEITNSNSQGWENKKTLGLSFKCPGCFCFTRFKVPFFKEIKSKFGFRKHSTKVAPSSTKMKSPTVGAFVPKKWSLNTKTNQFLWATTGEKRGLVALFFPCGK